MKKIIFYNHFHNGDLHVSRSFVRAIINKLKPQGIEFCYVHRNATNLLSDIPELKIENDIKSLPPEKTFFSIGETTYLNTWYNSGQSKYMSRHGITFDSLYDLFDDFTTQVLSCSLSDLNSDPKYFFPEIDFSFYSSDVNDSKFERKKILISNGAVLSGQAENFNFSPVINQLTFKYPNFDFYCTQKNSDISNSIHKNLFFTSDLIASKCSDLNHIGYLSTFCDLIVGRASGPWTFAFNTANLFRRKTKFLCFANLAPKYENKFWLGDKFASQISYSSNITVSSHHERNNIIETIEKEIQNLK